MKQKLWMIFVFLVLAALLSYFIRDSLGPKYALTIRGVTLEVEVAHTDYLRKKGLMGRDHLNWNKGMLFLFPAENIQSFWMKNTLIPLSLVFIQNDGKNDGKIVQIVQMEPDRFNGNLPTYTSQEKVKYVLETNMGWFEKNGIQIGDTVHFSRSLKKIKGEY